MGINILVGAQWGDEGKGKWIDILGKTSDIVARYQGGNNAGHTIYINDTKVVLHHIPSGIFYPSVTCVLLANVVINPISLISEIKSIEHFVKIDKTKLLISKKAHVITPWHIYLDEKSESSSLKPIGTTKRGIGPTYAYKALRLGLRMENYINATQRAEWINYMKVTNKEFMEFYNSHLSQWQAFEDASSQIEQYVCDAEDIVRNKVIYENAQVLMEGAQGSLLDIDHGTYPYVTSSSTIAAGALVSLGISPKIVSSICGIAKAYLTRVGQGPFPTELFDEVGKFLSHKGKEFGATTGRPRRCGWLDLVALKYSCLVNGIDFLVLNKMDVLCGLDEVKVAIAYEHPTLGRITSFPSSIQILNECKPIYRSFEGWSKLPYQGKFSDMPKSALAYVKFIEEYCECKIKMIGTGVRREDYLSADE